MHTLTHACTHSHTQTFILTYSQTQTLTNRYTHVHRHIYTYTHIHAQSLHVHTHTDILRQPHTTTHLLTPTHHTHTHHAHTPGERRCNRHSSSANGRNPNLLEISANLAITSNSRRLPSLLACAAGLTGGARCLILL